MCRVFEILRNTVPEAELLSLWDRVISLLVTSLSLLPNLPRKFWTRYWSLKWKIHVYTWNWKKNNNNKNDACGIIEWVTFCLCCKIQHRVRLRLHCIDTFCHSQYFFSSFFPSTIVHIYRVSIYSLHSFLLLLFFCCHFSSCILVLAWQSLEFFTITYITSLTSSL